MRSSDPHVPVVVYNADKALEFFPILWRVDAHDGGDLFLKGLYPITSDPVA